jgi:hypothetical protein
MGCFDDYMEFREEVDEIRKRHQIGGSGGMREDATCSLKKKAETSPLSSNEKRRDFPRPI